MIMGMGVGCEVTTVDVLWEGTERDEYWGRERPGNDAVLFKGLRAVEGSDDTGPVSAVWCLDPFYSMMEGTTGPRLIRTFVIDGRVIRNWHLRFRP